MGIMPAISLYRAKIFFGEAAQGNTATVALLAALPDAHTLAHIVRTARDATACMAWLQADGLQVRCYSGASLIEFCGHGLLSIANLWYSLYGHCPVLYSQSTRYTTQHTDGVLWLRVPRIATRRGPLPAGIENWFDQAPVAGATTATDNGYRILEWLSGTDLALLQPRLDVIRESEARGLIVTQMGAGPWDFTLRYFAPRYGNPEDAATGSAAAVLADYWAGHLRDRFHARQCSPAGGLIRGQLDGNDVCIGGDFMRLHA